MEHAKAPGAPQEEYAVAFVAAIDGPAGAGKSTVARRLARLLEFTYLDTGAMYRAAAWTALQRGLSELDAEAITAAAADCRIEFGPLTDALIQSITVNGEDATEAIRTPEVSAMTSKIATLAALRAVMVDAQRRVAEASQRGVVLEGRDIGTVVFPNAELKVFLTASPEERARRRVQELQRAGITRSYDEVLQDQRERDARDSSREASPLVAAPDAVHLNTDGKSIEDVVAEIAGMIAIRQKL
jgi:cytidylate kinase